VGFVLFARIAPPFFGFIVVALALWFGFVWMPSTRLTGIGARLSMLCTPGVVWLLSISHPLLHRAARYLGRFPIGPHTGAYEREDFADLIKQQRQQADNRMSSDELDLLERALKFDEYTVRDVTVPRAKVAKVSLREPVGPVLMDELHATNHTRFPVFDGDGDAIVGTLFLRDIVDGKQSGTVANYADTHVFYVHENDNLFQAIQAFRAAKQQILVVVNSAEEYVGIITVSDVLSKLINIPDSSVFTSHDDKAAVAHKHDFVESPQPQKSAEELASALGAAESGASVAETAPEVVK
jgi:CBS domain containing-hemolysin-like protein